MSTEEEKIDNIEPIIQEPLFRVVLPYKRTWYYKFKTYMKKIIFGEKVKALPMPK